MILFFGSAGSGKSVQGQLLSAHQGWRWLSAGQLLRDTRDVEVLQAQQVGKLVSFEKVNQIIGEALNRAIDINDLVLDGFPRSPEQARWLVESQPLHGRSIGLVIVLDVPKEDLLKRLRLRGRVDDTPESIDERLSIYHQEVHPILEYLTGQGVKIMHIDGTGTVAQVHNRITEDLKACNLI
jgi:adenylate kinase